MFIATKARLIGTGELIDIDMPELLFGPTIPEMIRMKEIKHVIKQQEIEASIINTYIRCVLYDPNRPLYGFISPHWVGLNTMIHLIEQSQYLSDRFMTGLHRKDMMWFISYISGHHQVLLGLKPFEQNVFFLDPLQAGRDTRVDMTKLIDKPHFSL